MTLNGLDTMLRMLKMIRETPMMSGTVSALLGINTELSRKYLNRLCEIGYAEKQGVLYYSTGKAEKMFNV